MRRKKKEKCNEYIKELDIVNKMIEEKYDVYEVKCILGYRIRKTYAAGAKDNKREKNRSRQSEGENTNRIEMGSRAVAKTSLQLKKKHW